MNATLLARATTLSGIIVFMKNVEKTSSAATHAAITINTGHLAFTLMRTTPRHLLTKRHRFEGPGSEYGGTARERAGARHFVVYELRQPARADKEAGGGTLSRAFNKRPGGAHEKYASTAGSPRPGGVRP
jgi:hypothetical protein